MSRRYAVIARRALLLLIAAHAAANAGRVLEAVALAPALPDGGRFALIVAAFGALWALVFAALFAGILAQRKHIGRVTIYAAVVYQTGVMILHLTSAQSGEAPQRAGFAALWAAAVIAVTTGLVWLWRTGAAARDTA